MTRREKFSAVLWAVAIGAAFGVAIIFLTRCGGTSAYVVTEGERAAKCQGRALALEFASTTCTEAQLRIDALVRTDPDCRALYPNGAPDICELYRARLDGGKDGDR